MASSVSEEGSGKPETVEEKEARELQELAKLKEELDDEELNKLAAKKMKEIVKELIRE